MCQTDGPIVITVFPSEHARKKGGKDQESIQPSTIPDSGYHMGK